jgi:hypothetical protein
MESTKSSLKKDEEVEVDIDVLEEEIETGKILLTDNKNAINSRSDKAGVRGEGEGWGEGGGGVKRIGGLSGCPVLSRCVCESLDSQLLPLHNFNYLTIIE